MFRILTAMFLGISVGLMGCKKEAEAPKNSARPASQATDEARRDAEDHGKVVVLGESTIGDFQVRAARDEGPLTSGGDAPIDVWLTGELSGVKAVRFWVGTESGIESVKARAGIENKDEPNHWHTHAEIPKPLPEGARLWVEIETDGATNSGSFDLQG